MACDGYDDAAKQGVEDLKVLVEMRTEVDRLEKEAKFLDDKIKILQKKWRSKRDAFGKSKTVLNDFAVRLTATAHGRDKVQAAWDAYNIAWGKLSKSYEKRLSKDQVKLHRSAKKRAKEILK